MEKIITEAIHSPEHYRMIPEQPKGVEDRLAVLYEKYIADRPVARNYTQFESYVELTPTGIRFVAPAGVAEWEAAYAKSSAYNTGRKLRAQERLRSKLAARTKVAQNKPE